MIFCNIGSWDFRKYRASESDLFVLGFRLLEASAALIFGGWELLDVEGLQNVLELKGAFPCFLFEVRRLMPSDFGTSGFVCSLERFLGFRVA